MDKSTSPDRGGIWPVPYAAQERMLIRTQAKYDRRSIPRIWFWPLLLPEDAPEPGSSGGEAPHEVYWNTPLVTRRYREPLGVHLYVDPTAETKGRKKGNTGTEGLVSLGWSRAEARRVGALLRETDDEEFTLEDPDLTHIYIPRPGDVFSYRSVYYSILQMGPPDDLGPTDIPAVWKGTAAAVREDSTDPGMAQLPKPPSLAPPKPEGGVPWRGAV